ncbi:MAG: hypothetical protein GY763_00965 [Gammaproteobacteria bacterium]|nr:hypothetical protein [Gammaproteobacteria bacterium]
MQTLSLVIVLVLDRIAPTLNDYRKTYSVSSHFRWLADNWVPEQLARRYIPLFLIIPGLLLVGIASHLFHSGFLAQIFNLLIAFFCMQPGVLNEDVDKWIDNLEADAQQDQNFPQLFGLANKGLFTVIFWFIVLGPLAAVAYRMLAQLCTEKKLGTRQLWTKDVIKLLNLLEWIPALISSFLFMVCGNFEAGLRTSKSLPVFSSDLQTLNESRLQQVGIASLIGDQDKTQSDIELVRQSRGLLLRSLVLWLALAALLEYWL